MSDEEGSNNGETGAPPFKNVPTLDDKIFHAYMKKAVASRVVARGIREVVRALRVSNCKLCVIVVTCEEPKYVQLVKLLCADKGVPLIEMEDPKRLGVYSGLCRYGKDKGAPHKIVPCHSVAVRTGVICEKEYEDHINSALKSLVPRKDVDMVGA